MAFDIKYREESSLVAEIYGDLDINSVEDFKTNILSKIDGNKDLVLDLKNLDYIDSTGLGAFMVVYKNLSEKNRNVFVVNAKKNIYKLFKITELDEIFGMED